MTHAILAKAFGLYTEVQAMHGQVATFNATMMELDEVFTRSRNDEVAVELHRIHDKLTSSVSELESENSLLRSSNELPHDLLQLIKRGLKDKKTNKRKSPMGDMSDVATALNRIEEVEQRNDLVTLEHQQTKAELHKTQKDIAKYLQDEKVLI